MLTLAATFLPVSRLANGHRYPPAHPFIFCVWCLQIRARFLCPTEGMIDFILNRLRGNSYGHLERVGRACVPTFGHRMVCC